MTTRPTCGSRAPISAAAASASSASYSIIGPTARSRARLRQSLRRGSLSGERPDQPQAENGRDLVAAGRLEADRDLLLAAHEKWRQRVLGLDEARHAALRERDLTGVGAVHEDVERP